MDLEYGKESVQLNASSTFQVNARDCQFDYGCQLFSPNDELVKFADVSRFYWAVKSLNVERLLDAYKQVDKHRQDSA